MVVTWVGASVLCMVTWVGVDVLLMVTWVGMASACVVSGFDLETPLPIFA